MTARTCSKENILVESNIPPIMHIVVFKMENQVFKCTR